LNFGNELQATRLADP